MKQVLLNDEQVWQAEVGMHFLRKDTGTPVGTMLVRFAPSDSIDNYEEVDIPEEEIANE